MDKSKIDYTLYLCTDRGLMSCETIEQSVEEGVKGGCTVIQLREKDCTSREFYELAVRVKKITDKYNVPVRFPFSSTTDLISHRLLTVQAFIWDRAICHVLLQEKSSVRTR